MIRAVQVEEVQDDGNNDTRRWQLSRGVPIDGVP